MEKDKLQWTMQKPKDHNRLSQATICQWNGQSGKNRQILKKV